jgi:hypothetical protein
VNKSIGDLSARIGAGFGDLKSEMAESIGGLKAEIKSIAWQVRLLTGLSLVCILYSRTAH